MSLVIRRRDLNSASSTDKSEVSEVKNKTERIRILKIFVLVSIAFAFGLALLSATGNQGLKRLRAFSGEVKRIEALNESLREENVRLSQEIEALRYDQGTIESVARDELGLVRPGERVFRFEDSKR